MYETTLKEEGIGMVETTKGGQCAESGEGVCQVRSGMTQRSDHVDV